MRPEEPKSKIWGVLVPPNSASLPKRNSRYFWSRIRSSGPEVYAYVQYVRIDLHVLPVEDLGGV